MSDQQNQFDCQNPEIYDNTPRAVIQVMPDTLDNMLRDFEDSLKKRRDIFQDLGLFSALLGTLLTVSQFKNFLGIAPDVWYACYAVVTFISGIKLVYGIFQFFYKKIQRKDILERLQDGARKKSSV